MIEGMDYPDPVLDDKPSHHLITVEILLRLQELDDLLPGDEDIPPAGIRLINRLSAILRKSRRAYRLLIDMMGQQLSLDESMEKLASRKLEEGGSENSRQAWLQNAQEDVRIVTLIYPELGRVMEEVLRRNPHLEGDL